jgi:hypothetical protein
MDLSEAEIAEAAKHRDDKPPALGLLGRDGKCQVGGPGQELPDLLDRTEL